ncbi:hypothetical protein N9440_04305 [Alphaproteobacteria bacterium]|nr:hypothetical protein [Alphaproteobacteria bacterium]
MSKAMMDDLSKKMRIIVLDMIYKSKSSHIGSCFSMIEIMTFINKIFNKNDSIIISKGHAAAVFYAFQYITRKISKKNLDTYNLDNSYLSGHVTKNKITKANFSSGSLGHGLPISLGLAISNKFLKNENKVFCVISDGELNEGSSLEALYYAPTKKLNNLVVFLDYNKIQSYDFIKDVINYRKLGSQLKLIGWRVITVKNGNNLKDFLKIRKSILENVSNKPLFIICNTVKGYGVKEFENNNLWHYRSPNYKQYLKFKKEILNA